MKHMILFTLALFMIAATAGCGDETGCPGLLRIETIDLQVQDGDGEPVETFTGTVTVSGEDIAVDCPQLPEDPEEGYSCTDGMLTIYATPVETFSADLQTADDPALVFSNDVALDVQTSFPDGEECGAYREAETTVTLEPASS